MTGVIAIPSLEQMAAKCRQSERNIINLIGELEQVGEVRARGARQRRAW